jgi:hypothetical protein
MPLLHDRMNCDSLITSINRLEPDQKKCQQALSAFEEIIADYQHAYPPAVSQTRKELKRLISALDECIQILDQFSPQSINLLCDVLGGPRGEVSNHLRYARNMTEKAFESAQKLPGRISDSDLVVLAYRVGHVMREVLKLPVSLTRRTDVNITGEHGGATYDNILRLVMECAGESPPDDLYPLMKRGVKLLADSFGNEHTSDLK